MNLLRLVARALSDPKLSAVTLAFISNKTLVAARVSMVHLQFEIMYPIGKLCP